MTYWANCDNRSEKSSLNIKHSLKEYYKLLLNIRIKEAMATKNAPRYCIMFTVYSQNTVILSAYHQLPPHRTRARPRPTLKLELRDFSHIPSKRRSFLIIYGYLIIFNLKSLELGRAFAIHLSRGNLGGRGSLTSCQR